ncbi:MAG: serine/threonine protein kinase [Myxococcales bacterium]|nr:serine/threonine protein kinase [Myxococcales bacterium]
MGDTYVARRIEDGRRVSVKLLDPTLFYNQEAVKRFARESRVTRTIDHPASMKVLDVGREEIGPYLVLEYVDGDFLSEVLAEGGPLEAERAARITARIATALEAAHAVGVIHRDLASSNVLLATQDDKRDIVKVTDFGLSLLKGMGGGDDDEELTAVGVRIGTPSYMAPEYIHDYAIDQRADIYGLGVMLYEMLTGELPYVGQPYSVMEQHVSADIPRPSAKADNVPTWLDDLVVHMMAKVPEERVQSAREVITLVELGLQQAVDVQRWVSGTEEPPLPREITEEQPDPLAPFIEQNLLGAEKSSEEPPGPDRLFVVARVARTSVAATIGVRPGWRVHVPKEDTGQGLLDAQLKPMASERSYVFFPPGGLPPLAARTTGLDLGMQLLRSAENVVDNFDPSQPDADALLDLWRQARWTELESLAQSSLKAGALNHPALLLLGAAQYERDRRGEGLRWVNEFRTRYTTSWPAVFGAIADLYLALDAIEHGRTADASELLQQAARTGWLQRAVARFQELNRAPLHLAPYVGRPIPDYAIEDRATGTLVRSMEVVDTMRSPQLLTVCVTGGRSSAHDDRALLERYDRFARRFDRYLSELHVVTSTARPDAPPSQPPSVPPIEGMRRLYDENASVVRALQPGALPTAYVFDHTGQCVHQGLLTSCDLWDALARASVRWGDS